MLNNMTIQGLKQAGLAVNYAADGQITCMVNKRK